MSAKVSARAKAKGFYHGKIIYPGEVFQVVQGDKAAWFDVENAQATAIKTTRKPKAEKSTPA